MWSIHEYAWDRDAEGEVEALGDLRPWTFVVNMKAGIADLPGDGNARLTFTRTQDVGMFVATGWSLEKWEADMGMVCSMVNYNEVVDAAENVLGGRKILVKRNTVT